MHIHIHTDGLSFPVTQLQSTYAHGDKSREQGKPSRRPNTLITKGSQDAAMTHKWPTVCTTRNGDGCQKE